MAGSAQQILTPEVRVARPAQEPVAPDREKPERERPGTPPVTPVAAPEKKKEFPPEPEKNPPGTETKPDLGAAKPGAASDLEAAAPIPGLNAASLLPIGIPSFDVRMPEFNEDRLVSRMRVRELTRIDEQQLDLRDMDLERYLPDGSMDYIISIERGFYAMSTGRLISSAPTRLRGKAIDLHGQGCVYARDDDVIKILGKVTSYIYVEKGQLNESKPKTSTGASVPPESPSPVVEAP